MQLTPSQIEHFREDGFLILPLPLSPECGFVRYGPRTHGATRFARRGGYWQTVWPGIVSASSTPARGRAPLSVAAERGQAAHGEAPAAQVLRIGVKVRDVRDVLRTAREGGRGGQDLLRQQGGLLEAGQEILLATVHSTPPGARRRRRASDVPLV